MQQSTGRRREVELRNIPKRNQVRSFQLHCPEGEHSDRGNGGDKICGRRETKERSAPNPVPDGIVSEHISLEELAKAPHGEENTDNVPVEKKHEDEAGSCNQVNQRALVFLSHSD